MDIMMEPPRIITSGGYKSFRAIVFFDKENKMIAPNGVKVRPLDENPILCHFYSWSFVGRNDSDYDVFIKDVDTYDQFAIGADFLRYVGHMYTERHWLYGSGIVKLFMEIQNPDNVSVLYAGVDNEPEFIPRGLYPIKKISMDGYDGILMFYRGHFEYRPSDQAVWENLPVIVGDAFTKLKVYKNDMIGAYYWADDKLKEHTRALYELKQVEGI